MCEMCRCRQRTGEHTDGVAAAWARAPAHAQGARHAGAMAERRYSWLTPEDRDDDSRSPRQAATRGPGAGAPERRMLRPPPLHPEAVKGRSNSAPPIGVASKRWGSDPPRHPSWRPPPLAERPGEPGATGSSNDAGSAGAAAQSDAARLPETRSAAHPAPGDPHRRGARSAQWVTRSPEELAQVILGRPVVVTAPRKQPGIPGLPGCHRPRNCGAGRPTRCRRPTPPSRTTLPWLPTHRQTTNVSWVAPAPLPHNK